MLVLEDFFINFCILCTGIFLIHHYFLKTTFPSKNSLRCRIRKGLFHGTFGIVLMHFGIQLQDGVLIDLRIVPIMIAASVGGNGFYGDRGHPRIQAIILSPLACIP